jgi:hypothetical protein
VDIQQLGNTIVEELPELYELRNHYSVDDGEGMWDYLEGTIEARLVVLSRIGIEAPIDIYTAGDC